MPKIAITGSKTNLLIRIATQEIIKETNYLFDQIESEQMKRQERGMTPAAANKSILADVKNNADFMKAWNNKIDKIAEALQNEMVAKPVNIYADANPQLLFNWILGFVKTSHCGDCERMSQMEARTIEEWRAEGVGLPREGLTECNIGCKCMLEEAK